MQSAQGEDMKLMWILLGLPLWERQVLQITGQKKRREKTSNRFGPACVNPAQPFAHPATLVHLVTELCIVVVEV